MMSAGVAGRLKISPLSLGVGVGDLIGGRERPDLILAEARPVGLGSSVRNGMLKA